MEKNKSKSKLITYDESDIKKEVIMEIPISVIKDFPNHPYKVKDDDGMNELVESIKTRGLIQPILVRPIEDGKYEMVSGHRRKRAFEIAGKEKISAQVQELTRDEAILAMVDSNLQREEILPSEKAFAYKMRLDAMKRQGQRTDITCAPTEHKLEGKKSRDILAEESGDSREQIRRYICLTNLISPLLKLVDEKQIAMRPAVELSYLSEDAQRWVFEAIEYTDATPSHAQTLRMRKFAEQGKLSKYVIDVIMDEEKPNQKEKSPFRDNRITDHIPHNVPKEKQYDYVIKALEYYNRYLQRIKDKGSR